MRHAIATAAALAALAAIVPASAGGAPAPCRQQVSWHGARYKPVSTRAEVPVARRLGLGTIFGCLTTRRIGNRHISVYAVRGVRTTVAVALRPSKPALYVSHATPTAAERRVLEHLRGH
jgi:hypothetical protein